jgi:hypothetical protein
VDVSGVDVSGVDVVGVDVVGVDVSRVDVRAATVLFPLVTDLAVAGPKNGLQTESTSA